VCTFLVSGLEWPRGFQEIKVPDFITTVQDGGKVISLTYRPPLPHRKYDWYSFLFDAELTPVSKCDRKDYVTEKFQ